MSRPLCMFKHFFFAIRCRHKFLSHTHLNATSFPIGVRWSVLPEITIRADLARMIAIGDRTVYGTKKYTREMNITDYIPTQWQWLVVLVLMAVGLQKKNKKNKIKSDFGIEGYTQHHKWLHISEFGIMGPAKWKWKDLFFLLASSPEPRHSHF